MVGDNDSDEHSLLSGLQREYLKSGSNPSDAGRQMRTRIWDRVELGLYDITIFNQYARPDDIKRVFDKNNGDYSEYDTEGTQEILDNEGEPIYDTHWVPARHMVALLWHGLRANKMDKEEIFEKVILRGIENGETNYKGVPHGHIESDISFNSVQVVENIDSLDPLEKWVRDLAMSGEDLKELVNRLPEGTVVGDEDIDELIKKHLIESQEKQ